MVIGNSKDQFLNISIIGMFKIQNVKSMTMFLKLRKVKTFSTKLNKKIFKITAVN